MKKLVVFAILFSFVLSPFFLSCEKDDEGEAPELPPVSSLQMDFSDFQATTKSGTLEVNSQWNFAAAALNIGFWNIMATVTTIIPVTAFVESFNHEAEFIGDKTWKWEYSVPIEGNTISAKLEGQVLTDSIEWRMYLSYDGQGGFEDFLWFKGTAASDRSGGYWTMYKSYDSPNELLQIDWTYEGDSIGSLKYTYVELGQEGTGNYIQFERFEPENIFDSRYTIFDINKNKSTIIEWSSETTEGRINPFEEDVWKCWDSDHNDVECN